jgi:hypothetical protein
MVQDDRRAVDRFGALSPRSGATTAHRVRQCRLPAAGLRFGSGGAMRVVSMGFDLGRRRICPL